jgi:hypothetical protein
MLLIFDHPERNKLLRECRSLRNFALIYVVVDNLEDLGTDGRIILRWALEKWDVTL